MNKNSKKALISKDSKKQKDLAKAKDLTGRAAKDKATKSKDIHKCYSPVNVKGESNWPCCNGPSTIMKK